MKTAKAMTKITTGGCPNFRHLSLFTILSLTYVASVACFAGEVTKTTSLKRGPASAFEEEVLTVPLETKPVVKTIFAEDDAGVMKGMKDSLASWEATEEYAKTWHLESTNLYNTPSTSDKKKFISKNLLRYADKRLSGEMRNAEEGTTMHSVASVEKSLRPNANVAVNKYISLKFKARVLQGKAIMEVRNPWVDCNATVTANGKMKVLTKKDFNQLGTSTGVEYNVNEAQYIAFIDQEITKNIKARLSSTTAAGVDADKRLEMNASFPFNL